MPTDETNAVLISFRDTNSGLCLCLSVSVSVSGASTSPGATADIYTCNNSVSEYWTVN